MVRLLDYSLVQREAARNLMVDELRKVARDLQGGRYDLHVRLQEYLSIEFDDFRGRSDGKYDHDDRL